MKTPSGSFLPLLLVVLVAIGSVHSSVLKAKDDDDFVSLWSRGDSDFNTLDLKHNDPSNSATPSDNKQKNTGEGDTKPNPKNSNSYKKPDNGVTKPTTTTTGTKANPKTPPSRVVSKCIMGSGSAKLLSVKFNLSVNLTRNDLNEYHYHEEDRLEAAYKQLRFVARLQPHKQRGVDDPLTQIVADFHPDGVCPKPDVPSTLKVQGQSRPKDGPRYNNNVGNGKHKRNLRARSFGNTPVNKGPAYPKKGSDGKQDTDDKDDDDKRVCIRTDAKADSASREIVHQGSFVAKGHNKLQVVIEQDVHSQLWYQTLVWENGHQIKKQLKVNVDLRYFEVATFCRDCKPGEKFHDVIASDVQFKLDSQNEEFAHSLKCVGAAKTAPVKKVTGRLDELNHKGSFDAQRKLEGANALFGESKVAQPNDLSEDSSPANQVGATYSIASINQGGAL